MDFHNKFYRKLTELQSLNNVANRPEIDEFRRLDYYRVYDNLSIAKAIAQEIFQDKLEKVDCEAEMSMYLAIYSLILKEEEVALFVPDDSDEGEEEEVRD